MNKLDNTNFYKTEAENVKLLQYDFYTHTKKLSNQNTVFI